MDRMKRLLAGRIRIPAVFAFILLGASGGCADSSKEIQKLLKAVLHDIRLNETDSLVVDTIGCKDGARANRIRWFNEKKKTKLFSRYRCMGSFRILTDPDNLQYPTVLLTALTFSASDSKKIKSLLEKSPKQFDSKVFNSYRWHIIGTTLVLIETFSVNPDPNFLKSDSIVNVLARDANDQN